MEYVMIPWWNWVKLEIFDNVFLTEHKKWDSSTSDISKNVYLSVFKYHLYHTHVII